MATKSSSTLVADVTTDARIQAIAQFMEDTLVNGGWVVTSDSGQTTPASLVHPTTGNQKKGYRVYRMNDSLQGTYPVFMRLDWGSSSVATNFAYWVTIGTGSDGSGNITGMLHNGGSRTQGYANGTSGTTATNSYGSAASNRCSFGLFVSGASVAYPLVFVLERSKDSSGADTGDGLLLFWGDYQNGGSVIGPSFCKYLLIANAGGTQPAQETGLNYILSYTTPSDTFSPGDTGLGLPFCFKGVAQQPGMNLIIVGASDVSSEGQFQIKIYGQTVTYQHMNTLYVYKGTVGNNSGDTNVRVAIRFD